MKDSTKISLRVLLFFFIFICLGTVFCTLAYVVYNTCQNIVAGQVLSLQNANLYIQGLLDIIPIVLFFVPLVLSIYLVSHSKESLKPFLVYFIMISITWFLLMPLCLHLRNSYIIKNETKIERTRLSEGYFREYNGLIYYYSKIYDPNLADGICIDVNNKGDYVQTFKGAEVSQKNIGFTDSIIEESLKVPLSLKTVTSYMKIFLYKMQDIYNSGYLAWLCFCSLGLALSSVICLVNLSKWRLINFVYISFFYMGLFFFNALVIDNTILSSVTMAFTKWIKFLPTEINPFLFVFNLSFYIITIIVGLILKSIHKGN